MMAALARPRRARLIQLSDETRIAVGKVFGVMSVTLAALGMAGLAIVGGWDFLVDSIALNFGALAVMLGVLTLLMIPTQNRNGSVWSIAWAAVFAALFTFGLAVAVAITERSLPGLTFSEFGRLAPADLAPIASFAVSFRFWTVVPAFWLPLTLGLLLFPNGQALTPRWKWVGWWSVSAIALASTATALAQSPWSTLPINSGGYTVPGILGLLNDAGFTLAAMAAVVSVTSLVVRYRRSMGVARSQIRWIALGGGIYVLALIVGGNFSGPPAYEALGGLFAQSALVASYGIAITRYRLYDIDVVISRTLTYGVLAAFITGVYVLLVVGIGTLLGIGKEPNLALSIAAVAIVAVAFEPLRNRVQHAANRLVFGHRASPYEVLAQATLRLADTGTPEETLAEVTHLVAEGTGAISTVFWVRVGEHLQPQSATPAEALSGLGPVPVLGGTMPEIPGEAVIPVLHRQELLGALTITKPRGQSVTVADEKVLADVAAGSGLLLRNIGLNVELAERAEQLRVSRRRLVAAQDAERHRLERDLHDGAQQQVVALKVKLGIARTLAEREGADQVVAIVTDLAATTQEAVEAMRAVAHGIYPPLLSSEGLQAALAARLRTFPAAIDVSFESVGRYERSFEESVYFCVVELLVRAIDGGASAISVSLVGLANTIELIVRHDGEIGDLVAIEDRVHALEGHMQDGTDAQAGFVSAVFPTAEKVLETA